MKKLVLSLLLLCCTLGMNATTYLVSVGIANYAYINNLVSTEKDVALINNVYSRHTNQVYTLLGSQATHDNVLATLRRVFGQAGRNDAVVFFFSGHGLPGGFCCYDTRDEYSSLTYTELQQVFRSCRAARKMVFADACYSGGMRVSGNHSDRTSEVRNGDVMFFLSSRTNEKSIENGRQSFFTKYLERGLRGNADKNKDRIITAKELYDFVHSNVSSVTRNRQHPVMWGRFNNTMTVLNWNRR